MNIFVVTPVWRRTNMDWLERCIASVNSQTVGKLTHLLVCDGDPDFVAPASLVGRMIRLPKNSNDYGDTPRARGIAEAVEAGADVIALLDDDNWYEPEHLEWAIGLHRRTNAAVVASRRRMVDVNGSELGFCADCGTSNDFADTSSVVYFVDAFKHLDIWERMDSRFHAIGDRVVWQTLKKASLAIGLTGKTTLNYRCTHAFLYEKNGVAPPNGLKNDARVAEAIAVWESEGGDKIALTHRWGQI